MLIAYVLKSDDDEWCPFCKEGELDARTDFAKAAQHLQVVHGFKCMHIGQESVWDNPDSELHQVTVAVFGADEIPSTVKRPGIEELVADLTQASKKSKQKAKAAKKGYHVYSEGIA